jgi:hypothetical protein
MLQFANEVILLLGNGITPYQYPDGGPVTVLGNTFTATYPNWVASTGYNLGDTIQPTVNNPGGFVFKATQPGVSGTVNPTFPQLQGQSVAETTPGSVIWQNQGVTSSSPAPRGAAHGLVYAGSLWVANTSPNTTADNLDGPTVLKMSTVNNPNSWNPLNVAFIGKDDGTQITGLATYTIAESGIAPVGSMVVFKDFETYQVIGVFGATDFSIQKAQTDMGCVAPRSIQFLPGYGLARLAHLGIAIFDGVRDRIISEEIRPYLFGGEPDIAPIDWDFAYLSKGSQTAIPPMYTLAVPIISSLATSYALGQPGLSAASIGGGTLPFGTYWVKVTAFVNGVESLISYEAGPITTTSLANSINVICPGLASVSGLTKWRTYFGQGPGQENQYIEVTIPGVDGVTIQGPGTPGGPGSNSGGLTRLLSYDLVLKAWTIIDLPWPIEVLKQLRSIGTIPITIIGGFSDDTVRRVQAQDPDWDGVPISYSVQTPDVFGKNANQTCYFRRLTIKGLCTGDINNIQMVATFMGNQDIPQYGRFYQLGSGYFELQLDLGFCGTLARNAHVTISGSASVANLPVEIHSIDWEIQPRIAGVPVSI